MAPIPVLRVLVTLAPVALAAEVSGTFDVSVDVTLDVPSDAAPEVIPDVALPAIVVAPPVANGRMVPIQVTPSAKTLVPSCPPSILNGP